MQIEEIKAAKRRKKVRMPKGPPEPTPTDIEYEASKAELDKQMREEAMYKRLNVNRTRRARVALREKIVVLNPYAAKVTQRSIQEARALKEGKNQRRAASASPGRTRTVNFDENGASGTSFSATKPLHGDAPPGTR
jgi:hypothetical protein